MGMLELLWPAVVLIALYALIGGSLAWMIGLRGLWVAAAAPAFATTVIGGASVISGWLGLGWSVLPSVVLTAIIGAGVLLVRRRTAPRPAAPRSLSPWWTVFAVALAALVIGWQTLSVIGEPTAISQTFDNVFHLNAIRYILDTGAASPLELGQMTSPNGGVPFYPSVWHATAAIVAQLSGASITTVVNAQTLVIAALIWPLGAVLLSRVLAGASAAVTISAAIVSASVPMFPLLPMDYGVLYPFQLALAMVPVALAATASMLGIGSSAAERAPGWWAFILLGVVPGVALAHPGGFVAWLALSVPMVAVFAIRFWRGHARAGARIGLVLTVLAYLALGLLLLKILRPPLPTRLWPTVLSPGQAALEVAQVSMFYGSASIGVAIALLLGLVWAVRERTGPVAVAVACWFVGAALFVIVIASPFPTLRDALTGSWYNNWPRLAAVFGVALVPLAAFGLARTAEAIARRWARARPDAVRARVITGVALAAAGFLLFPLPAMPHAVDQAHGRFALDDESALVSADEMALLERIPEHVPVGATIAGNPYTGTALAYAIGGRPVLMPHILVDVSKDAETVNEHLADADTQEAVCDAIVSTDVGFVLDFGEREVHNGSHPLPGLDDLEDSGVVRLVDSEGDARLYEVTACGLG